MLNRPYCGLLYAKIILGSSNIYIYMYYVHVNIEMWLSVKLGALSLIDREIARHNKKLELPWFLFVCGFSSHSRIFHSHGDVSIAGEGLQILTYARHSWPLSSERSLACHTYYDTGHPFIMVISEDP